MNNELLKRTLSVKTAEDGIKLQHELVNHIDLTDRIQPEDIKLVAGSDLSYRNGYGYATFVVLSFPELKKVEVKTAKVKVDFPYIPGLLAFREFPPLYEAFKMLESKPDLFVLDGQGLAHPRRLGIAVHFGIVLEVPALGIAKSKLTGFYTEPDNRKFAHSILSDKNGNQIGWVVRTREKTKPVFVSPGWGISIKTSLELAKMLTTKYRIPEPTRLAHIESEKAKEEKQNFLF